MSESDPAHPDTPPTTPAAEPDHTIEIVADEASDQLDRLSRKHADDFDLQAGSHGLSDTEVAKRYRNMPQICTRPAHTESPCNGFPRPDCPGYEAWREASFVTPEQLANDSLYKTIDGKDLPPEIIGEELHARLNRTSAPLLMMAYTEGRAIPPATITFTPKGPTASGGASSPSSWPGTRVVITKPTDAELIPPPMPEPSYLAPTCQRAHVANCACTGDARGPRR